MNKLLFGFLLLCSFQLFAQPMEVLRTKTVKRNSPVRHVFIDDDNIKWVLNEVNLHEVLSADFGQTSSAEGLEKVLGGYAGGKRVSTWPVGAIAKVLGDVNPDDITAGFYESAADIMWIGTADEGVFKVKISPTPQLVGKVNSRNSKLKTNEINLIYIDNLNRKWIGSTGGLLMGKGNKWKLVNKDYDIKGLAVFGRRCVFVGDEWLWTSDNSDSWDAMELRPQLTEGDLVDVAFDSQGRLWIASEIVSRYDEETDKYDLFGGPENFTSQFVNSIAIDQEDALWVGTEDKGLFLIDKKSAISVVCKIDQALSCGGTKNDAALKVIVSGGLSPYTYKWSGAQEGPNPGQLGPGEYAVTVTDSKGKSNTGKAVIKENKMALVVNRGKEESGEGNADGAALAEVTGGAGGYTYKWDNGETTAQAQKLTEGEHSVTVTDQEGCTLNASVDITRKLGELSLRLEETNALKCADGADATLEAQVSGGKGPFTYQWSDQTTNKQLAGLAAGTYLLTVTDAAGQKANASFDVKAPVPVAATVEVDASATTDNQDGQASVKASGGAGGYTYHWDSGETKAKAKALSPGEHSVTITDKAGCTATASVTITEDILPLQASIEQTAENKCYGAKEAALMVKVKGGKKPFQYQWKGNAATSEKASGLAVGTYEVIITDATGLSTSAKAEVKDPTEVTLVAEVDASATTDQKDGKASVKAKGGAGKYSYQWDSGESKSSAKALSPGEHSVTVVDQAGCKAVATVTITEDILPLQVSIDQTAENKCFGAEEAVLLAKVKGGKKPFQYEWKGNAATAENASRLAAGTYEVTITDATGLTATATANVKAPTALTATTEVDASASTNNKDGRASVKAKGGTGKYTYRWDSGETKAKASTLSPGEHSVTVTDEASCTVLATVTITEDILPLQVSIEQTAEINCQGESNASLQAKVKGGKSPFKYSWSEGGNTQEQVKGLKAGQYQVTVSDASGLEVNTTFKVEEPSALSASIKVRASATTDQKDGKAKVEVEGGSGNYTYKWSSGETSVNAEKLGPGQQTVTVTDGSGCATTSSAEITEDILPLAVTIQRKEVNKCYGENIAALQVEVSGGKGPFNYQWSDSSLSGDQVSGLKGGNYKVTITDASKQTTVGNVDIVSPEELKVEITKQRPATSDRLNDGQVVLKISGGTGNYTVNWDNDRTGESNKRLAIGDHQVTITDGNECQQVLSFEIETRIIPQLTANQLRRGQTVKLERLNFDADSTNLNSSALPVLNELFLFLKDNSTVVIEVGGHTNNIPEHEFCDRLSTARAKSVADYIVQQGVESNRVYYKGYGKRKPIESNRTKEGRAKNQRVEIKILKVNPG